MSDTVVADRGGTPDRIGRYEIRTEVGRGGIGIVYRAFDSVLQREVAVKVLHREVAESPRARERMARDQRAAAVLSHPNICPVFEADTDGGRHFVVTAWFGGRSLADELRTRGGPLPPRAAAGLVRAAALALEYAHGRSQIHGGLKPANILLDSRQQPLVTDFGQSWAFESDDEIRGTTAYLAPEQVRGQREQVGPAADVWALGVILYELLTGRPPFVGSVPAVAAQVVLSDPRPPSAVQPGIDPRLDAIVMRAVAKDPAARFTARGLADALGEYLRPESPSATIAPPSRAAPAPPPPRPSAAPPAPSLPPGRAAPRSATRGAPAPAPHFDDAPSVEYELSAGTAETVARSGVHPQTKARAVTRRATVRYYSRMNPDRMFPLLVILSAEQIAEVREKAVKQAESAGFRVEVDSLLELEPVLPGCDCYPPRESLPVAPEPVTATFYVVPHVLGRVQGARVVVRQGGKILSEVPLDVKVRKQTVAVLCGLLSLAAPYLMMGLRSLKLDYESQKADGFPVYQRAAAWALENVRPEWVGFGLVGLAVLAYFAMRPKKRNVFWDIVPKPVR